MSTKQKTMDIMRENENKKKEKRVFLKIIHQQADTKGFALMMELGLITKYQCYKAIFQT